MQVTIPKGQKAILNGNEVEFSCNTTVDFIGAASIDHVAELCAGGGLILDLSHIEDGKRIYYVTGKRYEAEIPKEKAVKKEAPKAEKVVEKKETKKKTVK